MQCVVFVGLLAVIAGVSGLHNRHNKQIVQGDQLNIGLILPHTNFNVREYTRAINSAVQGLGKGRNLRVEWVKNNTFTTKNVHNILMTLTPSPTGEYNPFGFIGNDKEGPGDPGDRSQDSLVSLWFLIMCRNSKVFG